MIPYLQSTDHTTAASSLLTVLHYFKPEIELTQENEFRIWHNTVNLPTKSSSVFGLAHYAKKMGLNPKITLESKNYSFPDYRFYRYTKEEVTHAAFSEQQHLKKVEKLEIPIEEKEITFADVKNELKNNNLLLLRLNVKPIRRIKRNTSNYVVVQEYSNKHFQIVDPGFGALSIPEKTMREAFESLETKKYRGHRMVIFSK